MERWIEHVVEPERLILAWRPPEVVPDRTHCADNELRRTAGGAEFRYYDDHHLREANRGKGAAALHGAGFRGYPAFNWDPAVPEHAFTDGALDAFLRRLPPTRRSDFPAYLERFRLRPPGSLRPLALLAATGATLPGDGFSLVDPLDGNVDRQDVLLEVAGHRHHAPNLTKPLAVGARVTLRREDHPEDPSAVRIESDGETLGYVSRFQSRAVSRWVERDVAEAFLSRVNGSASQPRAQILVTVRDRALQPAA